MSFVNVDDVDIASTFDWQGSDAHTTLTSTLIIPNIDIDIHIEIDIDIDIDRDARARHHDHAHHEDASTQYYFIFVTMARNNVCLLRFFVTRQHHTRVITMRARYHDHVRHYDVICFLLLGCKRARHHHYKRAWRTWSRPPPSASSWSWCT